MMKTSTLLFCDLYFFFLTGLWYINARQYAGLLSETRGATQQTYTWGSSAPRSDPLPFYYTIFDRKGIPFVYLLLINGTPFIYLV